MDHVSDGAMMVHFVLLFADVVGYSLLEDPLQEDIVQRFTTCVESTIPSLTSSETGFVLPTGDGVVIALRLADEVASGPAAPQSILDIAQKFQTRMRPYHLRIGLHIGRGREYLDFNGKHFFASRERPNNAAGTAINLAQRVMSLGDPGDILATADFIRYYSDERGKPETDRVFEDLGSIKVKHGTELKIFRRRRSPDELSVIVPPRRVGDYATAQSAIFSLLKSVHDAVLGFDRKVRSLLRPRVSLLLYDAASQSLRVSEYRYWADIDRNVPRSEVRFGPNEGPGVAFRTRRLRYVELPPPPPRTPQAVYEAEFNQRSGIPIDVIRSFARKSCAYLYYPASYGVKDEWPYGVVSIDTMYPIINEAEIARRLMLENRSLKKSPNMLEQRVKKISDARVDELGKTLQPLVRHLGYAWTIINHY